MFDYFYNGSIRKLVVGFGSLFNEIYISRNLPEGIVKKIKVPISYGPKEKFYRRIVELDEGGDRNAVENILPRIGFEITSMTYDGSRKLNSLNRSYTNRNEANQTMSYSYNEVPYNFEFNLHVMARNIEDGYQIVEQILPYFTPDFTITMNFTEIDKKVDVPIILNSVVPTDEFEGDMMTRRLLTHTFSFTAKSYIFSKITTSGLIREIKLTFQELVDD